MNCRLCDAPMQPFGELQVLGKYTAHYRRCRTCGYVCVEDPFWLEEAYAAPAPSIDTGRVTRNIKLADRVGPLIDLYWPRARRFLDYGGGDGLFVRLMRDRGYDFRWHDPYSAPVFAGVPRAEMDESHDVATAFEVFEHAPDPVAFASGLLARAPVLIFSTELLPETGGRPGEWHYYAPEGGQHISFLTRAGLDALARRLGLHAASDGRWLHVLSRERVGDRWLRRLEKRRWQRALRWWARRRGIQRRTLIAADAETVIAAMRPQEKPRP